VFSVSAITGFLLGLFVFLRSGSLQTIFFPVVLSVLFYLTARKAAEYYPVIIASGRKNRIDLTIQHAVIYLYAMVKGQMRLHESLRSLGNNAQIYGEAAFELGFIARDMEMGRSSVQAIESLIASTPSRKMEDFLKGLISVINSKGDLTDYFRLKSIQYHREAETEQKIFLEMLGSISEAYVVAVVAGPMFLIVVGIVMGMAGSAGSQAMLYPVVYGIIPIASVFFIILIYSLSRTSSESSMIFIREKELNVFKDIQLIHSDPEKVMEFRGNLQKNEMLKKLRNPFRIFFLDPSKALYAGIIIGAIFIVYAVLNEKMTASGEYLLLGSVIAMFPFMIFYEARSYRIRMIENRMPDFLRGLADASESGMTLLKSIEMILISEAGALTSEIRKVWRETKWGSPISQSLIRMSIRVRTPWMTRIVSLIVKASEATGNIAMVMNIAAEEAHTDKKLKQEREAITIIYVFIIYMTYFCFLFIAVILSKSFLPMMPQSGNQVSLDGIKLLMFHAASLNGFFSGLMGGLIAGGKIESGVKHSIIMLILTYLIFKFII